MGQQTVCNLCGSAYTQVLLSARKQLHAPQHWVIYRLCKRCGLTFLDLDYTVWLATYADDMAEHSADALERYSAQEETETQSALHDIARLLPDIQVGRGRQMVDVGAGAGGSLRAFQGLGWEATGVEVAQAPAHFAREQLGLTVLQEPYTRATLKAESVDFLYSYHTLEHLPRPYRTLTDFYLHLKPGGHLYVEVPDVRDLNIYHMGFGHISMFTPRLLHQCLEACGFEIIAPLDRSWTPNSFGPGFLCLKPARAKTKELNLIRSDYLPPEQLLRWSGESAWALRWQLWYGFHIGRGGEAFSWRAPLNILWVGTKTAIKRVSPRSFAWLKKVFRS